MASDLIKLLLFRYRAVSTGDVARDSARVADFKVPGYWAQLSTISQGVDENGIRCLILDMRADTDDECLERFRTWLMYLP